MSKNEMNEELETMDTSTTPETVQAEKEAKQAARNEANRVARDMVRENKDALIDLAGKITLVDGATYTVAEFLESLDIVVGNTRAVGKPRSTGNRVTKLSIILSLFTDDNGDFIVGKSVDDMEIMMSARVNQLSMGSNEIKLVLVKLAKETGIFIDIESGVDDIGFLYTYLGSDATNLHYEIA